ncbi:hypothetical protein HanIR_Chr15g0784101 [Helianthus annuus]|nr:hypothetical protein HanIR_Chr15g0784101 [Helianthus annuus]
MNSSLQGHTIRKHHYPLWLFPSSPLLLLTMTLKGGRNPLEFRLVVYQKLSLVICIHSSPFIVNYCNSQPTTKTPRSSAISCRLN